MLFPLCCSGCGGGSGRSGGPTLSSTWKLCSPEESALESSLPPKDVALFKGQLQLRRDVPLVRRKLSSGCWRCSFWWLSVSAGVVWAAGQRRPPRLAANSSDATCCTAKAAACLCVRLVVVDLLTLAAELKVDEPSAWHKTTETKDTTGLREDSRHLSPLELGAQEDEEGRCATGSWIILFSSQARHWKEESRASPSSSSLSSSGIVILGKIRNSDDERLLMLMFSLCLSLVSHYIQLKWQNSRGSREDFADCLVFCWFPSGAYTTKA